MDVGIVGVFGNGGVEGDAARADGDSVGKGDAGNASNGGDGEGFGEELDEDMVATNPLGFPEYESKVLKSREKTKMNDAVVTGFCKISGQPAVIAIMEFQFMGGSMGIVVGEKMTRAMPRKAGGRWLPREKPASVGAGENFNKPSNTVQGGR